MIDRARASKRTRNAVVATLAGGSVVLGVGVLLPSGASGAALKDTTRPSVPGPVRVITSTDGAIRIGWEASTDDVGIAGYDVYANGFRWTGTRTSLTVTLTKLKLGRTYTIVVKARDTSGNHSLPSNEIITGKDPVPPAPPTNLAATATAGSVRLTWTQSTDFDVAGYEIYRKGWLEDATRVAGSITLTQLKPSTSYTYYIVARDVAGNRSVPSEPITVTTLGADKVDATAPSAPTGLKVITTGLTSLQFEWKAATDDVGVVGYLLSCGGDITATATSLTATVHGLTPQKSYTCSVQAYDATAKASAASAPATGKTDSLSNDKDAPTTPSVLITGTTPTSVSLAWSSSYDAVGVAGYTILRDGVAVGTVTPGSDGLAPTAYTDTTVTGGQKYKYSVVAFDAAGNKSPASAFITAFPPAAAS